MMKEHKFLKSFLIYCLSVNFVASNNRHKRSSTRIRLVNGTSTSEGRLEVYHNGQWGTVCDDYFNKSAAEVVCRMLGYESLGLAAEYYPSAKFGPGTGPIFLDDIICTGNETDIIDCSHNDWGTHNCGHGEDVSVSCTRIRLVDGPSTSEGRLEVYHNSQWGTVCDDYFNNSAAEVVCRMLGYGFVANISGYYPNAKFGQGTGPILLDDIRCKGSETTISDCSHNDWGTHDCSHGEDVSVKCARVRLVDGPSTSEGRLEVYHNGQWGTVCDDYFDESAAHVVCRMLDYGVFSRISDYYPTAKFGQGTGPIFLDDIRCKGSETDIIDCSHNNWGTHDCSHGEDVSVKCEKQTAVHLVGGSGPWEGRIRIKVFKEWGSICNHGFDQNDAKVICRTLNFSSTNAQVIQSQRFGLEQGSILLKDLGCSGSESDLSKCAVSVGNSSCFHRDDAAIRCEHSEVRLVNGSHSYEGRVEIKHNGIWSSVCSNRFGEDDAKVICRTIGNTNGASLPTFCSDACYGRGNESMVLSSLHCTGYESDVSACSPFSFSSNGCQHSNDVGVSCGVSATNIRLSGGNTPFEGRVEVKYNGQWGTVCDERFDIYDAKVVCRTLGFDHIVPVVYNAAHFGQGNGTILMSNVNCVGNEDDLSKCGFSDGNVGSCTHARDVSVKCDTAMQMVLSTYSWQGLLQMKQGNVIEYVCDDGFTREMADSICRYLGYNNSVKHGLGYGTGQPVKWSLLDSTCNYDRSSHSFCGLQRQITTHCVRSEAVGITCDRTKLRLVGGSNPWEGRVEVNHNGHWGTICGSGFGMEEAKVLCRMLGFPEGYNNYYTHAHYGQGNGNILLSNVQCVGSEMDISFCTSNVWGDTSCQHSSDVGINCLHTKVRLVNGTELFEGRVEIYNNSAWHPVYITNGAAITTLCSSLGYNTSEITGQFSGHKYFGVGVETTLFANVRCSGTEMDIYRCIKNYPDAWRQYSSHSQDSSIRCVYRNIRLVKGPHSSVGRLEIYRNNIWGTVCNKGFTDTLATSLCKMLTDYKHINVTGKVLRHLYNGKGSGPIWKFRPGCRDAAKCLLPIGEHTDCSHDNDVSIACFDDTEIRLTGGNSNNEGLVQLRHQNEWGTLCDYSWDVNDAKVVCRQLGFWSNSPTVYQDSWFGEVAGKTWFIGLQCNGRQGNVGLCNKVYDSNYRTCATSDEAGIRCTSTNIGKNNVKLVSGPGPWKGRLDIKVNYNFGGVCWNGWTDANTKVICEMLNFRSTNFIYSSTKRTDYPLFLTNVTCFGNETDIGQCTGSFDITNCTDDAVHIDCSGGMDVRLVNGSNYLEGRVELFVDGQWKTICDQGWDVNDGKAICEMLGLPDSSPVVYGNAFYGQGSGGIAFKNIQCNGYESHIGQCSLQPGSHCRHYDDAGIRCSACVEEYRMQVGHIQSPNYLHNYNASDCIYMINPPQTNTGYLLSVDDISLRCCSDYIDISEGKENLHHLVKLVSSQKPSFSLTGHQFSIRFKSEVLSYYRGFRISWRPLDVEDAIKVNCRESGWDIRVNMTILKDIHNDSTPELIFLNNPNCQGKFINDIFTLKYKYTECQTQRKIVSNEYIYSNVLKYPDSTTPLPLIIRNYRWIEDITCHITKVDSGSVNFHPQETGVSTTAGSNINHHGNIGGSGVSGVEVELFKDQFFTEEISYNNIVLGQIVYVKVTSGSSDTNTKMRLHSCFASPVSYTNPQRQYFLIQDGCETDSSTHIISQGLHETRFNFQAFEFPTSTGNVFVKCNATLCERSTNTPDCNQSCHSRNKRLTHAHDAKLNTSFGVSRPMRILTKRSVDRQNNPQVNEAHQEEGSLYFLGVFVCIAYALLM